MVGWEIALAIPGKKLALDFDSEFQDTMRLTAASDPTGGCGKAPSTVGTVEDQSRFECPAGETLESTGSAVLERATLGKLILIWERRQEPAQPGVMPEMSTSSSPRGARFLKSLSQISTPRTISILKVGPIGQAKKHFNFERADEITGCRSGGVSLTFTNTILKNVLNLAQALLRSGQ